MPIHDWTLVEDSVFHDFHLEWISALKRSLNAGLLPRGFYAMAEQVANSRISDVLALSEFPGSTTKYGHGNQDACDTEAGGVAIQTAPPRVKLTSVSESEKYSRQASHVAIRHVTGDRVVALIEIVSPGNKSSQFAIHSFVQKARDFLDAGVHLLILDLFPPTTRDPNGIHGAIWSAINKDDFRQPPAEPLTLVAYQAADVKQAYIEPTAVGSTLIDMPLYLTDSGYILVPLEATYQAAFAAVPERWRSVLDASPA